MKTGYSMLLGEYVSAGEVKHEDTKGFQICCPECRDALFKVERARDDRTSEFFSHYKQPKEVSDVCELRVKSISAEQQAAKNAESRGQTLQAFRSVFLEAILLDRRGAETRNDVAKLYEEWRTSKSVGEFLAFVDFVHLSDKRLVNDFVTLADRFETTVAPEYQLDTAFSRSFQRRIALDYVKHISQPHAKKARELLILNGLRSLSGMLPKSEELRTDVERDYGRFIQAILGGSPRKVYEIFVEGGKNSSHPDYDRSHAFVDVNLLRLMVGTLLRLPYREMLVNHRAGRPMLEGIEPPADGYLGFARVDVEEDQVQSAPAR